MIGSPGTGKTMLARRLPTILPPLALSESLETTRIYSALGQLPPDEPLLARRPFRAPHHTISDAGMVGGGSTPAPGEISLAHHGVLFLDELPEFHRRSLEVLRQPLEHGAVTISRALASTTFPASFMLVAAMNPCPCGHFALSSVRARCSGRHASARIRRSRPALFADRRLRGNGARLARRSCREASPSLRNPSARRSPGWRGAGR
jgi:magnesium chelatase family protein